MTGQDDGKTLDNSIGRLYERGVARGDRPVYVISIAASLTGCHPRTLRIYEEEGLLEPVRTESNIRLYSDEDVSRVRVIRYLTQVRGVNLAGVKMLLQLRAVADLMRDFADALEAIEREQDDRHAAAGLAATASAPRRKGVEL